MPALPNSIVIGAAKAGTTSLCHDLALHPEIHFYHSKETHYFSFNYTKGLAWYKSLFSPTGQPVIMEGSPEYTTTGNSNTIAARMHATVPNAKLIYMVRHPMQRIESHYVQEIANGREPVLSMTEALSAWHLLDGSLYEKTYQAFLKFYPVEQIFVIFLDDYRWDKLTTMARLFAFLGISDHAASIEPRDARNSREDKYTDPYVYRFLRRFPGFYRLKSLASSDTKLALRRLLGRKVEVRPEWDPAIRRQVSEALSTDMAVFLSRFEKPADFWLLDK